MQGTTRILISIDVPTAQLREVYGEGFAQPGSAAENDLDASLSARLEEFYPGFDNEGYATPVTVVAVVVDTDGPDLSLTDLRGVYAVGVEGLVGDKFCSIDGCDNLATTYAPTCVIHL